MAAARPLICPILVGRDDLLERSERRLGQAADGRGHLLFLAGEAGRRPATCGRVATPEP